MTEEEAAWLAWAESVVEAPSGPPNGLPEPTPTGLPPEYLEGLRTLDFESLHPADREMAEEAMSRVLCPYYRDPDTGVCVSGCWEEPSCQTDEPPEGWLGLISSLTSGGNPEA